MICINTPGSYQCECTKGYKLDHDCNEEYLDNDKCKANQVCEDIDECMNYNDNKCPNNTKCVNTEGSFKCECLPGFTDKDPKNPGKKCEDIDECKNKELNKCSKYATCTNTMGSYNCTCTDGYEGDGIHCIPRKICDFNDHLCVKEARCVPCNDNNQECYKTTNRPAYYQCHCPIGFRGDGLKNGTGCIDIDECEGDNITHNICGDHAECINLPGRFECKCNTGYALIKRYGKNVCVNINECSLRKGIDKGAHDCSDNAICHDTDGSYDCICKNGFDTDPVFKGHTDNGCIDKRPPEVVPFGDKNMRLNQYSSYVEKGIQILHSRNDNSKHKYHVEWDPVLQYEYLLDVGYFKRAVNYTVSVPSNTKTPIQNTHRNVEIVDINECIVPKDKFPSKFHPLCHNLANCINTNGSYTCQCREGYQCKDCDGFTKEAATRNWKDEPWYNHKPVGINGGTGCIDTKPPKITLIGPDTVEISLCKCGTLVEEARLPLENELCSKPKDGKCYSAYDENDGDLTTKVIVTHRQLDNKTWEYNYTVSDSAGNTSPTIRRRVQVIDLDLANEMKIRKILDDRLSHRVNILNYRVNEHSRAALFIASIVILIIVSSLMIFGLFWKVYYMFLYIISPVALMSNKIGFEMGMDTYLRVRSIGAMNDLERKRRIIAQWTELYDIINGQDSDDNNNGNSSSRSVSEDEEGVEAIADDDDRDTHLGDSTRDSINTAEDEEEEEEEEGESGEGQEESGEGEEDDDEEEEDE